MNLNPCLITNKHLENVKRNSSTFISEMKKSSEGKNEKNLILEFGAEGGSLSVSRVIKDEEIRFVVNTDESDLEDNFYYGEKSFKTLDEAVKHVYLKYPILELRLGSVDPEYILPIAAIIKENNLLRNMDYDPVKAEADDQAFIGNIKKTTPGKWKELRDKLSEIRQLMKKGASNPRSVSQEVGQEIFKMYYLVRKANIVNPFNWPAWDEGRWLLMAPCTDYNQLDTITLCKLVTAIVRNEHFCKGAWEGSFWDGSMLKILEAITQKNFQGG
jgi:hypothetical protein